MLSHLISSDCRGATALCVALAGQDLLPDDNPSPTISPTNHG